MTRPTPSTAPAARADRRPRPRPARLLLATLALLAGAGAAAFDLQGHRGARGLAPENSLAAFEAGIRHGVTTLELDVAVTRDDVMVIHHDLALNPDITRDAAGRWLEQPSAPIRQLSWADLQAHDIGRLKPGTRYASLYPEQKPIDGTRIPRLADLFESVKRGGHDRLRFAIETKIDPRRPDATLAPEPFASALVDEIRRAGLLPPGAVPRVQILSFDWRTLQVVQRLAPEIPTVCLTAQQKWLDNVGAGAAGPSAWTAGVQHRDQGSVPKMARAAGCRVWSAYFGDLDAAQVAEAKALGLQVLAWTVNDAATMGRMIDLGVDGLVTDRPDIARGVLDARGIRPQ